MKYQYDGLGFKDDLFECEGNFFISLNLEIKVREMFLKLLSNIIFHKITLKCKPNFL